MARRLIVLPLLLLMVVGGPSYAEEKQTPKEEIIFGGVVSATCTPAPGAGDLPTTAILIAAEDLFSDISSYNCKWVKVAGLFNWLEYWHYRGVFLTGPTALYWGARDDSLDRLIVESFDAPSIRRADLHRAVVEITGLVYNLCDRQMADVIVMFGPCHYGHDRGWMIRDVHVDRVIAGPLLRLKGEANRDLFGTLYALPPQWSGAEAVRQATFDHITTVSKAPPAISADEEQDPDSWANFLASSPKSPIRRLKGLPLPEAVRIFHERYDSEDANTVESVISCVCTAIDCTDQWPLTPDDTTYLADAYFCIEVDHENGEWSARDL